MKTNLTITATMTTAMLAVAIIAICKSTAVYAQDSQLEINERLRACGVVIGMKKQLQCFNAIVNSLDQSSATTVLESTSAVPVPETVSVARAQTAAATSSKAAATLSNQESSAADFSSPASVNAVRPVVGTTDAEESFGLEAIPAKPAPKKKEQEKIKTIRATIVSAWPTVDGRFEARLDNGQVWRETARTRRNRLPREGSTVVISRGALGSYKMKIGNDNRLSAVRRTN